MSDTSMLSILIPTVGESTLEAAIAECRKQAPDAEIIVAGSGFSTSLAEKYSAVPMIVDRPTNKTRLLNMAFRIARNDRVLTVDADTLPRKGWADAVTAAFDEGKELFCGSVDITEGNFWMRVYNLSFFHLFTPDKVKGPRNFIVGCNYGMTKRVYEANGAFDESLVRSGDDYEYSLRAVSKGIQPYFDPDPVVAHLPVTKNTFCSVMRFWFETGYPTIQIRKRYADLTETPEILSDPWFVLIFAPMLALVPTYRVIRSRGLAILREVHYLPFIYLTKIAWCYGIFFKEKREKHDRDGSK